MTGFHRVQGLIVEYATQHEEAQKHSRPSSLAICAGQIRPNKAVQKKIGSNAFDVLRISFVTKFLSRISDGHH